MIRRIILGLIGLIAMVVVIVVVRAVMAGSSPQPEGARPPVDHTAALRIADHLGQAIRFQTISSGDSLRGADALDGMYDWMVQTYPRVHATLGRKLYGRSVVYTWVGTDSAAAPLVLMAHIDVVPVDAGSEQRWSHRPFSGDVSDGFVWGRGALDDKLNVIGELEAVEGLIDAGFTLAGPSSCPSATTKKLAAPERERSPPTSRRATFAR